ncbi:MAG: hypothetical protein ACM3PU_16075 [Gemmatimonadota bacterium]
MTVSIRSVVISLPVAGSAPELLRLAADIARLIGADLRALYVEDESLLDVAGLPLAREFDPLRPLDERWRPLLREQLARDLELAAATLRRRLADLARTVGVRMEFSVVRAGSRPLAALDELRGHGDFVFVVPVERKAQLPPLPAGAVLFAPSGVTRRSGDVVALADRAEAAAARLADRIAHAARARLVVIDAAGDAEQLQRALGRLRVRLIVADAGALSTIEAGARLAALRRVPVIVVPEAQRE